MEDLKIEKCAKRKTGKGRLATLFLCGDMTAQDRLRVEKIIDPNKGNYGIDDMLFAMEFGSRNVVAEANSPSSRHNF